MLVLAAFISGVFVFLYIREKKQDELLNERGITAKAWITNLKHSKASKKTSSIYYMEVVFFSDTCKIVQGSLKAVKPNTFSKVDEILKNMRVDNKSFGDYLTSTIPISYQQYSHYKVNDRIEVIYLKEDPKVIRLRNNN